MIEDKILLFCWKILDDIEEGKRIKILKYAPNKPDLFIECAKKYADCYGTILFSNDYTKIKKIKSFVEVEKLFAQLQNNSVILSVK
jgi:hypothetical protein